MFHCLLLLGIINEPTCTNRVNVTTTPIVQKKLLLYQQKECLNIQNPYSTVLINFGHVKLDAYLYIPGEVSNIEHYSRSSHDDFYGIDTGSRIGRIEITAIEETELVYSIVTFDPDCDERTVSTFDRQVMSHKKICDDTECHGDINKKFCYFNGFEWDVNVAISVNGTENEDNLTLKHGDDIRVVSGSMTETTVSSPNAREVIAWVSGPGDTGNSINIEMSGEVQGSHVILRQTMTSANPTLITGEMIEPHQSLTIAQICLIVFGVLLVVVLVVLVFVVTSACHKKGQLEKAKKATDEETGINGDITDEPEDPYSQPIVCA